MHINEAKDALVKDMARIDELNEKEDISDEERTELTEVEKRADETLASVQKMERDEKRKREAASLKSTETIKPEVRVIKEESTYRPGDLPGDHSYFRDLWHAQSGDMEARDRLQRNNAETRDLTRTDTSSVGEFVPPLWLIDLYMPGLRAGRPTANLCTQMTLPGGTDSINLPRITTNATVAAQTADNAAVNEVDTVSGTVTAPVRTFAGQNDVAIQVLEQSPLAGGFDQLLFRELGADLDRYTDLQVLNGSGSSGQITGILNVSGIKDSNYTDATPTVAELFTGGHIFKVQSLVTSARFEAIEAAVMHPRRWYWMAGAVDSSGRPFVLPAAGGPNNANGIVGNPGAAEGFVGWIGGVPAYIDANVPVTLGVGGEDAIIFGRFSDAILMEGTLRTRFLPEVLSGNLTVRCQLYRYVAFTAARAGGVGFGTVTDTGLDAPSGY